MEIETERLTIRSFRTDDLTPYMSIAGDPDAMKFVGGVQSTQDAAEYIAEMIQLSDDHGLGRYAVELKSDLSLVGFCGFRPAGEYLDFGYRYAKRVWGQGVGMEAALAVREYGLHTLKVSNVESIVAVENQASVKILNKLKFKYREEILYEDYPAIRFRDQCLD